MSFLYAFLTYLQPGILWPALAELRPAIILSAAGAFCALFYTAKHDRRDAFAHPVFLWLVAFVVAQVLSVYYGGVWSMLEELSAWSTQLVFVAVSLLLIAGEGALRRYVWGMIAGGMFVVVYGIYAFHENIGFAVTGRAGAYGMYENHNDYSFIIVQLVPFLYLYWRAESGFLRRGFLALSLAACAIGMALSLSRGGMLALVLEGLLIVLFAMKGARRFLWLPVMALLGIAAIVHQFESRAENQAEGYTAVEAERSRFELWWTAKKMIQDRPLLGVGSRRFPDFARVYSDLSHDQVGKVAHNTFLEILSTSGLVGFGSFSLMLYFLLRDLRRRPPAWAPTIVAATQTATLISLCAVLFRALLASKTQDWSFYTLAAIGVSCALLLREKPIKVETELVPA